MSSHPAGQNKAIFSQSRVSLKGFMFEYAFEKKLEIYTFGYWVGDKVRSGFPFRCYRKT